MKLRNKSGITLIALIVTIIVLIIIAGISIAILTADNGILRQTNSAKVTQIEGTAREQVQLACSAMRLAIAEASAEDNKYSARANALVIQNKLLEVIKADTTELKVEGWKIGGLDESAGTFEIIYEGSDYENATNSTEAEIIYEITLGQKSIEITDEANATLKDQNGNDVEMDIGGNSEGGSDTGNGGSGGNGSGGSSSAELNEYGFYFDVPYSITYTTDGQERKAHYVFKEDGSAELYGTGWSDETSYVNGFLIEVSPVEAVGYSNKTITIYDEVASQTKTLDVSDDGLSVTNSTDSTEKFVCTFEEYHDVYYEIWYYGQITSVPDLKFKEDGSVISSDNSMNLPAGGATLCNHQIIFDGSDSGLIISMDGKRIYSGTTLLMQIE